MSTPAATPVHEKERKGFFSRLRAFVVRYQPVLTIAGCIISFVAGGVFKVVTDRRDFQEKAQHDWTEAVSQIGRDGAQQLNDALLVQAFESNPTYAQRARQMEFSILEHMNNPEDFDLVYFNLQTKTRQDQMAQLEELDRSLSRQVRVLMNQAAFPADQHPPDSNQRLQQFLLNPAKYLNNPDSVSRAEALLYELDSVSGGLYCVLKEHEKGCPSLHPTGKENPEMILVNRSFAGIFADPQQPSYFQTCSVQQLFGLKNQFVLSCAS